MANPDPMLIEAVALIKKRAFIAGVKWAEERRPEVQTPESRRGARLSQEEQLQAAAEQYVRDSLS